MRRIFFFFFVEHPPTYNFVTFNIYTHIYVGMYVYVHTQARKLAPKFLSLPAQKFTASAFVLFFSPLSYVRINRANSRVGVLDSIARLVFSSRYTDETSRGRRQFVSEQQHVPSFDFVNFESPDSCQFIRDSSNYYLNSLNFHECWIYSTWAE